VHTDRPNSTDTRPLYVRAHRAWGTGGGEKATDGGGGSGYADLRAAVISLVTRFELSVLGAEGVGDALVGGVGLPVDAVG
jgi:hypothetical protein